jgi:hypothetical protein
MGRTLIRQISVGAVVVVVAAAASGAAFANHGHGKFGGRNGSRAGGNFFGQPGGAFSGGGGGGGFAIGRGGPGGGGGGFGGGPGGMGMGQGPGGGGGGGGILGADILTPASAFLGIPVTTLETDLAGGKTLAQEAVAKGKTAADLITALVANEKAVLGGDVAAGWITADQQTAVLTGLTSQITDLVNSGPRVPPTGGGQANGPLQTASTYLGISVSDLQADLKAGKTLASLITGSQTVAGLVAAIEAPAKTDLDAAVTAGKITAAQETTILTDMTTHLTDFVNGTAKGPDSNTVRKNLRMFALKAFGLRR